MGVCNSPDMSQGKIYELFECFNIACAYIDDLLVITKNSIKNYLKALDRVLQILAEAGLKVNAENSSSDKQKRNILVSG